MGLQALPLSSSSSSYSHNFRPPATGVPFSVVPTRGAPTSANSVRVGRVRAQSGSGQDDEPTKQKQSLLGSVTEALDFSQTRSAEDARLLDEARRATKSGGQMNTEQYGALRRKIGGTYKDFFKSYVDVEGRYVEEGWVDKTCKVCKKDTAGEPRQVDRLGNYVHVACLDKPRSTNFFSKLFSL